MVTLSLAMIVKDEEAYLGHCLASVRGLVEEIVIVDTGSSDRTPELALAEGAKVHRMPWPGDFSLARNESLKHCSGDWVLILDADEAIDALDHPRIRAAIAQDRIPAFRLVLRNYLAGGGETVQGVAARVNDTVYAEGARFSHFADGKAVRLCRRFPDLGFRGKIHELLEPYFQERGLEVRDLEAVIHHFGKADRQREAGKKDPYLELARKGAQEEPGNLQLQFHVLQQAMVAEAWPVVLEAALACLGLAKNQEVHPLVFLGAGTALQFQGRHAEAILYLDRLLVREPDHSQGLTRRAVSLAALGRLEEARMALRRAILAQPGFIVPYVNLAELESQQGDYKTAREALLEGLARNPRDPQLLHALVQLGVWQGDLDRAVEDAVTAIQRCPQGGLGVWHRLIAFQLLKKGERLRALEVIDLGLSVFPGNEDLIRLRSLVEETPSSI